MIKYVQSQHSKLHEMDGKFYMETQWQVMNNRILRECITYLYKETSHLLMQYL